MIKGSRDLPPSAKGKLEFKHYGDGTRRMRIKVKGLELEDGARLDLRSGGNLIAVLAVLKGRAELDEERAEQDGVPPLDAGEGIALLYEGAALLVGTLVPD